MKVISKVSVYAAPAILKTVSHNNIIKVCLTLMEAKGFLQRVAYVFGIPAEAFYMKYITGHPYRKYGNVSLSEIKKVIAFRLYRETTLNLKEIAEVVGSENHTSIIHSNRKVKDHIASGDEKFMSVYRRIEAIHLTGRVM